MRKPIKTMAELTRKVKRLVGKGRYFTVTMGWRSYVGGKKPIEEAKWAIYHEDLFVDRAESENIDDVFQIFKAQWKAHKSKSVEQDIKKELAAVGPGPEVK